MEAKTGFKIEITNVLSHWITIVSIFYAYVTLLNIIHTLSLYKKFQINIFEYFEPYDILIGAFYHSEVLLYWSGLILLGFTIWHFVDRFSENKGDKISSVALGVLFAIILILSPIWMIFMSVQEKAYEIIYIKDNYVSVKLKNNNRYENFKLVGTAGKFHFYYSQKDKKVFRINEGEIVSIENDTPLKITDKNWWINYVKTKLIFDKRNIIEDSSKPLLDFSET